MTARGAIAAGHPLTAEAGADVLRNGGNAVDAAVGAILMSFAAESPLTGLGAGGFMLVHTAEEDVLLDFFVEVPGRSGTRGRGELVPISVYFDETPQVFNCGPASCGVPGNPAGLAHALERFGTMQLRDLAAPAAAAARDGVEVTTAHAAIFKVLEPILTEYEECRALYAPEGRILEEGEVLRLPDLAEALERYGEEGPALLYEGEIGRRVGQWVCERGGTISPQDMAAYEVVERDPICAFFRDRQVLTNPPPSSGGILIAFALALLERVGSADPETLVPVMEETQRARSEEFHAGLYADAYLEVFLAEERLAAACDRLAAKGIGGGSKPDRLGSTTHIAVIDADGNCASVTCSNGSGSGVIVPGTGVHVNNMLGEEDLNPMGFHAVPAGRRMTSMMAPTVVLGPDGAVQLALGSAGSNRIRSAILQTIIRMTVDGMPVDEAVRAGRLHFEDGVVQAEPGVDPQALERLEAAGYAIARWKRTNLFFGGVQAVSRDPATGELRGAGDPRRGGVSLVVE